MSRNDNPFPAGNAVDSRYYLAIVGGSAWLAGIWLGSAIRLDPFLWAAVGVGGAIGAVAMWRRGRAGLLVAAVVAVAWGGWRYTTTRIPFEPEFAHFYNGAREITVRGDVIREPQIEDTRSILRVAANELIIDGQTRPVKGVIQVETGRFPAIDYGSTLRMTGDLVPPVALGSPGYAAYLERQGILSVMRFPKVEVLAEGGGSPLYRALLHIKARSREAIAVSLPEPHAALLTGILLGDSRGMPRELEDDFRETGMTHIIAISGFNIAVIIAMLDTLTAPLFPRRMAAMVMMVFIGLYAVLVGAGASVVRASLMGITYLIGIRLMGRPTLAMAGLFTAAVIMTAAQPDTLWDIGFQLSFAATLGLMLYAGPWTRRLDRGAAAIFTPQVRGRVSRLVGDVLVVTLAAQVLTLPLILYHFGRLSLASLPANVLVLPAQAGVMAAGGITMALGSIWPPAGQLAGLVAWAFLHYTISTIRLLARLPAASVPLPLSFTGLLALYALVAAVTFLSASGKGIRRSDSSQAIPIRKITVAAAGLVLIVAIGFMVQRSARTDGRLRVAFLDVGQGDAIFIQTPNGRQMLIDGGHYPSDTLDQLGRQMPFWDRSIDIIIATHPDADHVTGLVDVVGRYRVSQLITNGADEASDSAYAALLATAGERDTPTHTARKGEVIRLDEGVSIEILHAGGATAENRNDASVVARLSYGLLTVLLTGDAETGAETAMLMEPNALDAVVLKAGHHGANTSSSEPFLAAVSPQVVIISAGRDNPYGHPHPAMLERVESVGAAVLRTDELGTIEMVSDGQRMWWTAELGSDAMSAAGARP